ncbi:hypothetical protein [Luteimonas sp. MC1828]|uniref:hypothetical protein n=1 Tax=Luteimonas sp. MC1828 TaxID=2799787 RepID=UPI0018F11159|nr:hypothetical protein [Luteimonas sp. MC1828]MBJ7575460.1 hypothetical protein [Luteimonas sp. MC1828]
MTDARYLKLLWIYVALTVAAIVSMFFPDYSEGLLAAYDSEPSRWILGDSWLANCIMGGFLLAWLAGLAGLFFFKTWARSLSLCSTLASFLISSYMGASLYGALENALFEASSIIWGAILALSYFSPVSDRFGR